VSKKLRTELSTFLAKLADNGLAVRQASGQNFTSTCHEVGQLPPQFPSAGSVPRGLRLLKVEVAMLVAAATAGAAACRSSSPDASFGSGCWGGSGCLHCSVLSVSNPRPSFRLSTVSPSGFCVLCAPTSVFSVLCVYPLCQLSTEASVSSVRSTGGLFSSVTASEFPNFRLSPLFSTRRSGALTQSFGPKLFKISDLEATLGTVKFSVLL
jgi:hypothetical protein